MPVDIRYHAISLIAVFMALTLGILIGFAALDPNQIKESVNEIKKENAATRLAYKEELEGLREQGKVTRDFEKAIVPELVKNRLTNRRVLILLDDDDSNRATDSGVVSVLESASAEIAGIITLRPQLAKLTPKQVIGLLARRDITCPTDKDPRVFLANRLGQRLALSGSDFANFFEDEGLIRVGPNSDLSKPVGAAIVISSGKVSTQMMEQIEEPLFLALKEAGVRVVGCEYKKDNGAAVAFFQQLKIPTVDCVDTYPGQVALILALTGADGNYGVKNTTDRLIPEFDE